MAAFDLAMSGMIDRLRALREELGARGVAHMDLFGSVARGDADADSDIDLLVELSRPLGFKFFSLEDFLSRALGAKVELSTRAGMRPRVLAEAERESLSGSFKRWPADVESMIAAAERALGYVRGMAYDDFIEDSKTIDAVVMNLIVLAEAAKGVPEELQDAHPEIPWAEIAAFRNRAAHTSQTVDLSLDNHLGDLHAGTRGALAAVSGAS